MNFRIGKTESQAERVADAGCVDPKSCSLGSCPVLCGAAQFLGTEINVQQHGQPIFLNVRKKTIIVLAFFFFSLRVKSYVFAFNSLPVSLKLCLTISQCALSADKCSFFKNDILGEILSGGPQYISGQTISGCLL